MGSHTKNRRLADRQRSFEAAQFDHAVSSWALNAIRPADDIANSLATLRVRARDLANNSPVVAQYLRILRANVCGTEGIRVVPQVRRPSGKLIEKANAYLAERWAEWCQHYATPDGGSFADAQDQWVTQHAVDGEAIALFRRDPALNPFGFAVQLLPADYLDERFHDNQASAPTYIAYGIERERAFNRPVAFHLFDQHPGAVGLGDFGGGKRTRVLAEDVVFRPYSARADTPRAVSWLTPVMRDLRQLGKFEEAALVGKVVTASKMVFLRLPEKDGDLYTGAERDDQGNVLDRVQPGEISILPQGADIQAFSPNDDGTGFGDFVAAVLRKISAGLGVSSFTLGQDWGAVNYSSARIGLQAERDLFADLQQWLSLYLVRRVYREWLRVGILTGALQIPAASGLSCDALAQAKLLPRSFPHFDPQKEAAAHEKALACRLTSVTQIIREQGGDPDKVFEEIIAERDFFQKHNIASGINIDSFIDNGDADEP